MFTPRRLCSLHFRPSKQTLGMVDELGAAGLLGMKLLDYGEQAWAATFPVCDGIRLLG